MLATEFVNQIGSQLILSSQFNTISDDKNMFHWLCKLTYQNRSFTFDYYKGKAHVGFYHGSLGWKIASQKEIKRAKCGESYHIPKPIPPQMDEVLFSLALDCSCADYTFEEWANEYGYDTDSRKAEATYHQCQLYYNQLLTFFGRETFNKFRQIQDE